MILAALNRAPLQWPADDRRFLTTIYATVRPTLAGPDRLVLFTDGVTGARSQVDRELYGDDRLRALVAGLADMSAARTDDAIQQSVRAYSGADTSDDTVALVLQVPRRETDAQPGRGRAGSVAAGRAGLRARAFLAGNHERA